MRKILMVIVLMYANLFPFQTETIQYKGKKIKIVSGEIVVVIDTNLYTSHEIRNTFHGMGYWVIDSIPQLKAYLSRIPQEGFALYSRRAAQRWRLLLCRGLHWKGRGCICWE